MSPLHQFHPLAALLPYYCILCGANADQPRDLCRRCQASLPFTQHCCQRCALPLPRDCSLCGRCLQTLPHYDNTLAVFHYVEPIRQLITTLKFSGQLAYARLLGELLQLSVSRYYHDKPLPDIIMPVPLHHWRLRKRGFNQAAELARYCARALELPLSLNHCARSRATRAQSELPLLARHANIRSAFTLRKPLPAKHVAIVDDVVTTASTVNALARLLKKHGICQVDVWCIARTPLNFVQ